MPPRGKVNPTRLRGLSAARRLKSAGRELLRAGIEIRLDPGWKTYWRYPGDSGRAADA